MKNEFHRVIAIPRLGGVVFHLLPHAGRPCGLGYPRSLFLGVVDVELVERVTALEERVPRIENILEVEVECRVVEQRDACVSGHRNRQQAVHRSADLGGHVEGGGGCDDLVENLEEAVVVFDPEDVAVLVLIASWSFSGLCLRTNTFAWSIIDVTHMRYTLWVVTQALKSCISGRNGVSVPAFSSRQ